MTDSSRIVYSLKSFFDPLNMIPVFLNLVVFMCVQITFFWFVASRTVTDAFIEKARYIHDLMRRDSTLNASLMAYLFNPVTAEEIPKIAAEQKRRRDEANFQLVITTLGPPIGAALGVLVLLFIIMMFRGQRLTKIDFFLLSLVIFAFSTELVFFFVLVRNYIYLGDLQFINTALDLPSMVRVDQQGLEDLLSQEGFFSRVPDEVDEVDTNTRPRV